MPKDSVTVTVTKAVGCFPGSWNTRGDGIEIEVVGTDGYYHHDTMFERTGRTCVFTNSRGITFTYYDSYEFTVPGAAAGVKDIIKVKVPGEDGDPDTILCIAVYFDVARW
jgi:hypothetical protein